MTELVTGSTTSSPAWPSVDEAPPAEEGGPIARRGFNYQDEIAAGFLLEMLKDPGMLKIHCETHDDILVVRSAGGLGVSIAEFVQVKAGEKDKFWTVPDICSQKKKGTTGTSIFETFLGRDRHEEVSRFRLVTLRPVAAVLSALAPTPPLAAGRRLT